MNLSDISIILRGLDSVAKAYANIKGQEVQRIFRSPTVKTITKNAITALEETASSAVSKTTRQNGFKHFSTEVKERSSTLVQAAKIYSTFVQPQKTAALPADFPTDIEIEHPIVHDYEPVTIATTKKQAHESSEGDVKQQLSPKHSPPTPSLKSVSSSFSTTAEASPEVKENSHVKTEGFKLSPDEIKKFTKVAKSKQKLSEQASERKVPSTRASRLLSYGGLAAGIGLGAVAEVTRRGLGLAAQSSNTQSLLDFNPFLSEANANRIVNTLCKVRGAALKLGQMLSLQDNAMINPQLAVIFERVRQSADFMPSWQMERVMVQELGPGWRDKFSSFETRPFAAASIGQVHSAELHDGTEVALKIQYPGVAEGIRSDIRSLLGIVNLWNIFPKGLYLENIMAVAERELKYEVDYIREASAMKKFQKLLELYPQFVIPKVHDELCTSKVLVTELIYGKPVDSLINEDQGIRNWVAEQLLHLCLLEVFIFQFMQTDPNWSNFFYNHDTGKIALLDFGASRGYDGEFIDNYMTIIKAAADQDRETVLRVSQDMGFLTGYETKAMEQAHTDAVMILGEAFSSEKPFDFSKQSMTHRIHRLVPIMLHQRLTPPPEEIYSLHRKVSGVFLLCTKLQAVIDCRKMFNDIYEEYCEIYRGSNSRAKKTHSVIKE